MRALLFSAIAFVPLAASAMSPVAFSDVPDNAWFATYVYQAADIGVVSGYTDTQGRLTGKFGPGDGVTIGQALKMAVESAGYDAEAYWNDSDKVGSGGHGAPHWADPYMAVAIAERFSFFTMPEWYGLDTLATRAQMAQIIADAYKKTSQNLQHIDEYSDLTVTHPHAAAIDAVTDANIMVGDGRSISCSPTNTCIRTTFRPNASLNRAEAVKIVMVARAAWKNPGVVPPMSSSSKSSASPYTIRYTPAGFVPSTLTVPAGTTVTILNETTGTMSVDSDPHPQHTDYPLMNSPGDTPANGYYRFTFEVEGTYKYHNHLNAAHKGTIIVAD